MNDDKEFDILSYNQFSEDNYKWEVKGLPMSTIIDNSIDSRDSLQTQVYDLISKTYSLECENKELVEKIDNLETEIVKLLYKVEDLEEIIVKIYEKYILIDDD